MLKSLQGDLHSEDGIIFNSPNYCKQNCNKYSCKKEYESLIFEETPTFKMCHKGFIICSYKIHRTEYVIHGMIDTTQKEKNKKIFQKEYFQNLIELKKILKFIENFTAVDKSYYKNLAEKIRKHIYPYHDIKRLIGTIVANIEKFAKHQNPNSPLSDAVEKLDDQLKTILITTQLIDSYTTIVDAFSNPDTLKSGKDRKRAVYKSFDKITRILSSKAKAKKLEFKFYGTDFTEIYAYDSLDLLPFILLDNAIKYSLENNEISLYFSKTEKALKVSIENIGCYITEDEKEYIFKKFNRGKYASNFSSEGSGVGLNLAIKIAEHHNAKIEVSSEEISVIQHNSPIAKNVISVIFNLNT